jgi:hypothetical protein
MNARRSVSKREWQLVRKRPLAKPRAIYVPSSVSVGSEGDINFFTQRFELIII